jgi:superfamily I DNA/RNA helicase/RecB family exonuclease
MCHRQSPNLAVVRVQRGNVVGALYPEDMTKFDASQRQVLDLDPMRHARVLGAPGTGKTMLLVESFARVSALDGWREGDVLVLAPNRLVGADLRGRIERRISRPIGGTFVRTAPSLAFAVLQRQAALQGRGAPRLLTGTAHDEVVESVIAAVLEQGLQGVPFSPEMLLSDAFRAEIRELSRVLDDFALQPSELVVRLRGSESSRQSDAAEFAQQWVAALELLEVVNMRIAETHPGELSSSALQRAACEVLRVDDEVRVPRLVLIDDAAELGEGALALLAALVERGTKIWVFGDPDTATGAFHGERTRVMAGLGVELARKHATRTPQPGEQSVVLERVYRHGSQLRELVSVLTERIGAAGAGQQRRAISGGEQEDSRDFTHTAVRGTAPVCFAAVATPAEQIGVIAHRMRAAHLGLAGAARTPWSEMAVICRSRAEVKQVARLLAGHQVPGGVAAGGVVLREHQLVRELIRLLQHALGIDPIRSYELPGLLTGTIGGLDPISLRRLRGALRLQEVRQAQLEGRKAVSADELLLEHFALPGDRPALDMRPARRLRRFGRLAADGASVRADGGTPREVLWQIWQGSRLAPQLQSQALDQRGARSDEAHRALDSVVGLFFALQRHEEQDSERPIADLLDELLMSTVPTDSLAARSQRDVVTITTPQGAIGREFDMVCVLGVQDGAWPNLRARGSLLGVTALERLLRGDQASRPSRRDTMHDELRLLAHSVARAKREVLVVSLSNEEQHPGAFFSLGAKYRVTEQLPSSRLTLRGVVAEMRRRLTNDRGDSEARDALVALARDGVSGAHPDEWYGVRAPSSDAPLADIEHDPAATVSVSPSQMERAERCPLDWFVSRLGGGASDYRANIGTLLHHAMETAVAGASAEDLMSEVQQHWGSLKFEAKWQEERALQETEAMAQAISRYLGGVERSGRQLLANEASFVLPIDYVKLRGTADRIEAEPLDTGGLALTVVDLKTGRKLPTAAELQQHAQLQAYQLGVLRGAFSDGEGAPIEAASVVSAKLIYVHPSTVSATRQKRGEAYTEVSQAGLDAEQQQALEERVREVGRIMAGSSFTAQLEHHCQNEHVPGRACSIHIIPAVSHA